MRVFFCSSLIHGSRRISLTRSVSPSLASRMPARMYSVSELISRARAICWRISADGLREPALDLAQVRVRDPGHLRQLAQREVARPGAARG